MTAKEIEKLRADAEAARAAAAAAVAESEADPDNPTKKQSAEEAIQKSKDADAALTAAAAVVRAAATYLARIPTADTSRDIQKYKGRIVAIGAYLFAILLVSCYLLGGSMLAETDAKVVNKILADRLCCKSSSNSNTAPLANAPPSPTATPTPTPTTTPTSSPTPGAVVSPTPGAATSISPKPTSTVSPEPTRDEDRFPQANIPPEVYLKIPGVTDGVWSADGYVFLVVFFAGMLGGTIRAVYSFVRHLGLKDFSFYWTAFYLSLPFTGAGLSEVIYFVLRGGFYGGSSGKGLVLNLFSFAALAALTGLFSDQAMEKLKQVAVTLLAEAPPKVDNANAIQEQRDSEKKNLSR